MSIVACALSITDCRIAAWEEVDERKVEVKSGAPAINKIRADRMDDLENINFLQFIQSFGHF